MAYTGTPVIRQQLLWVAEVATDIWLDTPAWFLWLQTAGCPLGNFSYALGRPTDYRLTLPKEKRRYRQAKR